MEQEAGFGGDEAKKMRSMPGKSWREGTRGPWRAADGPFYHDFRNIAGQQHSQGRSMADFVVEANFGTSRGSAYSCAPSG